MVRNALSYGDTDSDNPLARAAAYAAPWTTDGADTSVGAPSVGAGADAVGQWMAAQLAKMQGSRPTAPIWNPDNPVGTETLQSFGMPQPTNYVGPVGQFVDPNTGQLTEQGQARMADNPLLGFDTGGIGGVLKGFHGSPHAFDRFSNDAIGSGEGAQAYGYGHYLADSEGVAKSYRDALSGGPPEYRFGGDPISAVLNRSGDDPAKFLALGTLHTEGNLFAAQQKINSYASFDRDYRAAKEWMDANAKDITEHQQAPGHMYEVNVNAEPEHFLDWDAPLGAQSDHVKQAIGLSGVARPSIDETTAVMRQAREAGVSFRDFPAYQALQKQLEQSRQSAFDKMGLPVPATGGAPGDLRGSEYLSGLLTQSNNDPVKVSEALKARGIPGIRYLDAGSRGKGEGSRNTVVFDPATMDIIRRYGLAGLMAGGGAAALGGQGQQQ